MKATRFVRSKKRKQRWSQNTNEKDRNTPLPEHKAGAHQIKKAIYSLGTLSRRDVNLKNPYRSFEYYKIWNKGKNILTITDQHDNLLIEQEQNIIGKQFGSGKRRSKA